MKKTISVLALGMVALAVGSTMGGCGSDAATTVTTGGSTKSSSSSSSSSGDGGAGGAAGAGGMMAAGGNGGNGGGMSSSTGGMGGGGAACTKPGNGCGDCLYGQCQAAYCECAAEPACFAMINCIQACPPNMPDCPGGCYVMHAAGFAEFTIASSCAGTLCAPSCPGSNQVKPCDLCLAQKCEMQLETCVGNVQCIPLIDCRKKCAGNTMCEMQCDATFPQGLPLMQDLLKCASAGCAMSCN